MGHAAVPKDSCRSRLACSRHAEIVHGCPFRSINGQAFNIDTCEVRDGLRNQSHVSLCNTLTFPFP